MSDSKGGMVRCEELKGHPDFVPLATIGGVAVDLRYAGAANFVGRPLYEGHDCAWVHVLAAQALRLAAKSLARRAPTTRLLVLDALRPHRVQEALWKRLAGSPLERYLAHPDKGSIHSYGMAIDVTLIDAEGRELDMGSAFDEMSDLSHPELEDRLLAEGRLESQQVARRRLLREAMASGGFAGIPHEWWHFDLLDREHVRRTFTRVD